MVIDVFTSANINYLAKARVLARSLREQQSDLRIHLMLSDKIPEWLRIDEEDFDSIITIDDLGLSERWIFKHSVVELCTAVKPFCFQYILDRYSPDFVFYFDPDVVVFSSLERLLKNFDNHSILLTPHVCKAEVELQAIIDNETSCLRHGIYNLGFLGVKADIQGRSLIAWWSDRLTNFCQDNIPFGVFTDQRWMDFVPVYFENVKILKDPIYNVATWNYSTRDITGSIDEGILVDGQPICFHHFSGVDNGASVMMLEKYAHDTPILWELDVWYKSECDNQGQQEVVKCPWFYGFYDNGQKIERRSRLLYRENHDLQEVFHNPRMTMEPGKKLGVSFFDWMAKGYEEGSPAVKRPFSIFLCESRDEMLYYIKKSEKLPDWLKGLACSVLLICVRLVLKVRK